MSKNSKHRSQPFPDPPLHQIEDPSEASRPSRVTDEAPLIQIENLDKARFRCVFPECGGLCCRTGRPPVTEDDEQRIRDGFKKFLPHLRPDVHRYLKRHPWLNAREKSNGVLAVAGGWCVFYNDGCVLQKVGMAEGTPFRYKPDACIRFPLQQVPGKTDRYYVRQWNYRGEGWDLFCLNPHEDPTPAREGLKAEIEYLEQRARDGA
jgi:hypothetical protein